LLIWKEVKFAIALTTIKSIYCNVTITEN